ncbi:MAG: hypothetical protein AABY10_03220 [Nanoarchaeota archaeon]
MAERDEILKEKLEYSGIFDFAAFYVFANSWLKEEGFKVSEDKYSEKTSGNKRDIDVEWKATKELSDYFKTENKIKFEIRDLTDIEVEIDGKNKTTNKGKVSVEIKLVIVKDHKGKWETSAFSRMARDIYNKYIIPSRVGSIEGLAIGKTKEFREELKTFLEIYGKAK